VEPGKADDCQRGQAVCPQEEPGAQKPLDYCIRHGPEIIIASWFCGGASF
jgi:hypothetical protein